MELKTSTHQNRFSDGSRDVGGCKIFLHQSPKQTPPFLKGHNTETSLDPPPFKRQCCKWLRDLPTDPTKLHVCWCSHYVLHVA